MQRSTGRALSVARRVVYLESAWQDFDELYQWIAASADPATANTYLSRLEAFCQKLRDYPDRGTPRDDAGKNVRTLVFENRALIAYRVEDDEVRILRILHHGRDASRAFRS